MTDKLNKNLKETVALNIFKGNERIKKMKRLRKNRYKLREIGEMFGITKQRVYKILKDN